MTSEDRIEQEAAREAHRRKLSNEAVVHALLPEEHGLRNFAVRWLGSDNYRVNVFDGERRIVASYYAVIQGVAVCQPELLRSDPPLKRPK